MNLVTKAALAAKKQSEAQAALEATRSAPPAAEGGAKAKLNLRLRAAAALVQRNRVKPEPEPELFTLTRTLTLPRCSATARCATRT